MCLRVEGDGLVAGIVADHVAFSTVDTHVFVDDSHHLLCVIQGVVGTYARKGLANHILCSVAGGREEGRRKGERGQE